MTSPDPLDTAPTSMGEALRQARLAQGWTQAELAASAGWTQSKVSRAEAGRILTNDQLHHIASVLGVPVETLRVAEVRRRNFLGAAGALALSPAVAPFGPGRGAQVGQAEVAAVHERIATLRAMDWRHGGGAILDATTKHIAAIDRLLGRGTYSSAIGTALQRAYGEACADAGFVAFDAGADVMLVRGHFTEAVAALQDSPALLACTYATLALHSLHRDRPREAVSFAQAGQRAAKDQGGWRLHSLLHLREAMGWARLGDRGATEEAIRRASQARDLATAGDPAFLDFFGDTEFAGAAGTCWLDLARTRQGLELLREASAPDPDRPRNQGSWTLKLATGYARAAEPEEACIVAVPVLPAVADLSSARVHRQVAGLRAALAPFEGLAEVRDFQELSRARRTRPTT